MILRRIIEHVKAQNWTAVALDFVIVVMGVFLGIQLGNWNEARADTRLGAEYAERLIVDLNKDLASSIRQIAYYDEVLKAVQETRKLLKNPDADPQALVISAYRASEIMFAAPNQATWDQIVSSGHLGLLPKGVVAVGLADYYSFDSARDAYDTLRDSSYRQTARRIIPLEIQAAMRAGCSDKRDADTVVLGFAEACTLDADPSLVRSTADALRRDPELEAALNHQYSNVFSSRLNLSGNLPLLNRALAALEGAASSEGEAKR